MKWFNNVIGHRINIKISCINNVSNKRKQDLYGGNYKPLF